MKRFRVAVAGFAALFLASAAWAQTSSVTGRVTNLQGVPIAGADVALVPPPTAPMPGMRMPAPAPDRTTRTGADGTFTLTQVPNGTYVLQIDAPGLGRASQEITVPNAQPVAVSLEAIEVPGGEAPPGAATAGTPDMQALLNRIKALEARVIEVESGTVLSEPETRVKRIEVYVDAAGVQHDEPVPGAKKTVTYQRERVYRRQTINEKLEAAITDADAKKVAVGVSVASVTQFADQTKGDKQDADGHFYQLSSADLFFSAGLAQYTSVFVDLVGLSGAPPDAEIPALTLLNSYTARLVRQNEVNVREAWLRTEFFSQKLALVAGRLDLTNFFDRNVAANDETSQFISDALVNNPALGLGSNGAGVAAVLDPKNGFAFKGGFQQSNPDATNLSESLFSLVEVDYLARPPGIPEGNYRVWFRNDNSTNTNRWASGVSLDQKLTNVFTLFGRYGIAEADENKRDKYYSLGFQVANGGVFNPLDVWGVGFAQTDLATHDHEKIVEGYYNFKLSEKLRLSLHLQHVLESPTGAGQFAFLLPGIRLQARF